MIGEASSEVNEEHNAIRAMQIYYFLILQVLLLQLVHLPFQSTTCLCFQSRGDDINEGNIGTGSSTARKLVAKHVKQSEVLRSSVS